MSHPTRRNLVGLMGLAALAALALAIVCSIMPAREQPPALALAAASPEPMDPPLRLGLIPEQDLFEQRQRYGALADFLAEQLDRPVELVTARSYAGVLQDLADEQVDAAFLGSLVTLLAVDRLGAEVLVSPCLIGGICHYRGIIFVPEGSAVQRVEDLAGRSIAMVRTTTGGNLFPIHEMQRLGLLDGDAPPRIIWLGTHDDVVMAVLEGHADAGAMKDLRLNRYEREHAELFRRLGVSGRVPENALVVRAGLPEDLRQRLKQILLSMTDDAQGRSALERFGAERFRPCHIDEYEVILDMVEALGENWARTGIPGPPPRRPAAQSRDGG